jgi:hypothetical protein
VILDDFVMLGKTVPEASSDGREFVCTAGYSLEMRRAVRIDQMGHCGSPPRWSRPDTATFSAVEASPPSGQCPVRWEAWPGRSRPAP